MEIQPPSRDLGPRSRPDSGRDLPAVATHRPLRLPVPHPRLRVSGATGAWPSQSPCLVSGEGLSNTTRGALPGPLALSPNPRLNEVLVNTPFFAAQIGALLSPIGVTFSPLLTPNQWRSTPVTLRPCD